MARISDQEPSEEDIQNERLELLEHIDALIDPPLIVLSFLWLALLVLEFTVGLSRELLIVVYVIWGAFIVDFVLEYTIAPRKLEYLQRHWLTAIALVVPAFRVLRIVRALRVLRAARAARTLSLARIVTSTNRGMRTLRTVLGGARLVYVVGVTVIVTFVGSAGMFLFERAERSEGFQSYGDALWWTAMAITTMGSQHWPQTVEGRVLGWLLAFYAFAIFGYITATFATLLLGVASEDADEEEQSTQRLLGEEISALRTEIAALREQLPADEQPE